MASPWGSSWGVSFGASWAIVVPAVADSPAIQLPDPQGISFNDWGARVTEEFAQYGVPVPFAEDRWKDWACSLFHVDSLVRRGIPAPDGFNDWRLWAQRFLESVR
jgi:hypothetical protein